MSDSKVKYMQCWIRSRCNQKPPLLIKDHTAPKEDGTYTTRLLIPATNFTQYYAKLTYKTTKAIFHANNVQYDKHTID